MVKIISWNIARRHAAWRCLTDSDADIALLQEAGLPPDDVAARIEVDPVPFLDEKGHRISRSAIAKLSDRARVEWLTPAPLNQIDSGDFVVSHTNSVSAAIVTPPQGVVKELRPAEVLSLWGVVAWGNPCFAAKEPRRRIDTFLIET